MNKKRRQSIRVILVDDEDVVLDTLTAFLEDWGFQVFTADEGDKGIEILKEQPMDIAIVDIRLRGYDGNTFILKAHELQPGLKFLIHTGSSSYTVPHELAALGISEKDIFLKPIRDFKMLLDTINQKIGN